MVLEGIIAREKEGARGGGRLRLLQGERERRRGRLKAVGTSLTAKALGYKNS